MRAPAISACLYACLLACNSVAGLGDLEYAAGSTYFWNLETSRKTTVLAFLGELTSAVLATDDGSGAQEQGEVVTTPSRERDER